ncbi:hypothetical protein EAX61_06690 [Dokdonia sinensis]|uniref:Uncharacterized protein n=1 Tax=Dokdonia sinensis TaxID=2479847 RepID=A0A3M0G6J0_9FLAO|nr:hypothetical protein [Dokdonia sinensis]RMB60504.1 hypothetical protein EAX61_06690 [Dokdonia sinensis]
MEFNVINLFFNLLPALIVALVSVYFFSQYTKNEEGRRRFLLHKDNQKTALPLQLQAYERLTLLLERIAPSNLLLRVKPFSDDKDEYERLLLKTIEQEFEHNLTQQVYVTEECWNVIRTAKSATVSIIRKTSMNEKVTTSDKLRETILRDLMDHQTPSDAGLSYIKKEVAEII